MDERNLIIICITAIICAAILSFTIISYNNTAKINETVNNSSNNTTNITLNESKNHTNNTTSTTTKSTSKSNSKSSSKSNSNNGYKWSAQYGDYIREYTDSEGVQHIESKGGMKESYNPKTGVYTSNF
ncbi:hypothetical protein PXD04_08330 [Methanosphaera sp. ISO3-F5]|uniref:hypothetical protein n=1 Tax=Methanosphaera sp. ISO3-F5 TaxID=1452353 RepID=UPI002B262E87|nr:hypothetical protein [Methanosphaera sp. ISO3-F5]WQH63700.1 hypothetical protein PXD04_08330 [Methanosphaera sp. ISO3-F5]